MIGRRPVPGHIIRTEINHFEWFDGGMPPIGQETRSQGILHDTCWGALLGRMDANLSVVEVL